MELPSLLATRRSIYITYWDVCEARSSFCPVMYNQKDSCPNNYSLYVAFNLWRWKLLDRTRTFVCLVIIGCLGKVIINTYLEKELASPKAN